MLLTTTRFRPFLSTPSARRATVTLLSFWPHSVISIHALREEGDGWQDVQDYELVISIHALREEGDIQARVAEIETGVFLSTPSARRATGFFDEFQRSPVFLSTPSARRATQGKIPPLTFEELFLSTPSARRATRHPRAA